MVFRITARSSAVGRPMYSVLSSRPGLNTASSKMSVQKKFSLTSQITKTHPNTLKHLFSLQLKYLVELHVPGRLVAAITNTCLLDSIPSISVNNWFTTLALL